ncbi:lysozyme inhibitor LprI family protein [Paracoccus onubensis]|nr:lysozyme inhibitor LprI family protein [Paracoccus onubensis]
MMNKENFMKHVLLSSAFIALTLHPVHADQCEDAADQATMTECAQKAYQASDAELNRIYQQIEHRLNDDADRRELLAQAERAWITFRDAECSFSASAAAGGTVAPMVQAMCLDELTQQRIDALRLYLDCPEGDLSCPLPPAG